MFRYSRAPSPQAIFPVLAVLAAALVFSTGAVAVDDFTFIHASDVHAPMRDSKDTIAWVGTLGEVDLGIYGVKAPKPSFALVSGDLMEFGGGSGWWKEYLSYWEDTGLTVYHSVGNHDNTWHATMRDLRTIGQGLPYSFDRFGCHFVVLASATIQDPRPSFGEEQIPWLRKDLSSVRSDVPIFVVLHHPLKGSEFASGYDCDRLLDVLRQHNTVLVMAGHSHGHVHSVVDGVDQITGGSTFGPNAGVMLISVVDGVLRAAYQKRGDAVPSLKILEKPLPSSTPYPQVEIRLPKPHSTVADSLTISGLVSGAEAVDTARYSIDESIDGGLTLGSRMGRWTAEGRVDIGGLLSGAHSLRVEFQSGGKVYSGSTQFFVERPNRPTAWRAYLGAATKATPIVSEGVVYVGANDGVFHAFDAESGAQLWQDRTGAEILAQALAVGDRVFIANGDGKVIAYTRSGRRIWTFTAGDAVYSSPVFADGRVIFGCNDGRLYGVFADSGELAWTCDDATYSVESKPFVSGNKVYYGAWDEYVRCVDTATGTLLWKQQGEGSRVQSAKRYFSPADAMPVVAGGRVFVADRDYRLAILNADSGERITALEGVSAVGVSEDGAHVYVRKTNGDLVKMTMGGEVVWTCPASLGAIPAAPIEKDGIVYVSSGTGLVSAISARWGRPLWQYRASPQLFVMCSVNCDGARAYVASFDGYLTAIRSYQGPVSK